jgi:hypothetical protein
MLENPAFPYDPTLGGRLDGRNPSAPQATMRAGMATVHNLSSENSWD